MKPLPSPNIGLFILRAVFIMVAVGLGFRLINDPILPQEPAYLPTLVFGGILAIALAIILIDSMVKKKQLDAFSSIYFGLVVGLFLTYVLQLALSPVIPARPQTAGWVNLFLGMVVCYICISLIMQTKDDFRFIIPYVEFSKEVKGLKPYILDTSVIIDGRIADVAETQVLDNQLIMPRFVISELQAVADSGDRLKRSRGRRGLDILNKLRTNTAIDIKIFDNELPELVGQPVDLKLVLLAKHLEGKIVTNDYNLNKVAKLHGVGVLNLNDLANALKPVCLPGETLEVRVVKPGEEAGQGVGYLDDGTMIVIEGGREHINQLIRIGVTSVLQTSAGRMIFGRYESTLKA